MKHKKIATLTAVHPPARFGELKIKKSKVIKFEEKPQLIKGWINGGFFVFNFKIFKFLTNKNVMLERDPIQRIIKIIILWHISIKTFGCAWILQRDRHF